MQTDKDVNLLGKEAKDAVTGFSGVISTMSFDVYRCVQAFVTPPVDEKGEMKDGKWFDVARLIIADDNPAMKKARF